MARLRFVLAALLALFALLTLLDRFVLIELLVRRIGVPVLAAAVEALACAGVGALLTRRHDPALNLLVGYPILGTACFLIGLLKINVWTMVPVVVAAAILGARNIRGGERAGWHPVLLLLFLPAFVMAQAPPSSLDELAYHLAVPRAWVLEGRAIALPLLSHSWFPLGVESADLPLLALLGAVDGGVASHFLHLFAAFATTVLLARRTNSRLATAAIVTTPALLATAGWSLVDWPLLGLFVVLFTAGDDDRTASAATAAGLLTKYTFAPFALLVWAFRRRLPKPVALLGLAFFARNLILARNPVAPFFSADAPHVAGYRARELASYVFDGAFVDEALGTALVALPVLATSAIALASLAVAVVLFFLGPSSRITVPYLAIPALDAAPMLRKRVVAVLASAAIVLQLGIVVWLTATSGAFALLTGAASEEEYLRRARPSYTSIAWLNATLPAASRTLLVGSGETYWFAHRVRGGGNFDGARVSRYLELPTPEALRARLESDGITHVAIVTAAPPTSVARKVEERQVALTPSAQQMLARTLDRYASNVVSRGDTALFSLRSR